MMKPFYRAVGKLRNKTLRLDSTTRRALATTVAEECSTVADDWLAIDDELAAARASLQTALEKEQFLGIRVQSYRKALDEQARFLSAQQARLRDSGQDYYYEEEGRQDEDGSQELDAADLERRMEQWEKDEDALERIVRTHKEILVHCEEMRRKIAHLEKKKKEIVSMTTECENFLTTAREAQQQEEDEQMEALVDEQDLHLHEMELADRTSKDDGDDSTARALASNVDEASQPNTDSGLEVSRETSSSHEHEVWDREPNN